MPFRTLLDIVPQASVLPRYERYTFRRFALTHTVQVYGKHYAKIAMSMAEDENRNGSIFWLRLKVKTDEPKEASLETGENPS